MDGVWVSVFVVLGVVVGSFLNLCIDRLPNRGLHSSRRFHCSSCSHQLAMKEIIPVLGYLLRRGRCNYCRARIPGRPVWVEIGSGALFGYLWWHYGLSIELGVTIFYCCVFIVIMVIDLEHRLILNKVTYPAMAAALLISLLSEEPGIIPSLIGGGIGLGLFFLVALLSKGGMGGGDVKMAALIGFATGLPLVFVALFLAIVLGGVVALILLVSKKMTRKEGIPFGPFLSIGTIATFLFGHQLLGWFLALG